MDHYARRNIGSNKVSFIFVDFQQLQRICTHPRVLLDKATRDKLLDDGEESEGSLKDFIDDRERVTSSSSSSSSSSDSDSGASNKGKKTNRTQQKTRVTRAQAAHSK